MRHAMRTAASLAAAVSLLSCPTWGQETEVPPLPPDGGQPGAISAGTPAEERAKPHSAEPLVQTRQSLSAEEAERRAQAEFRHRLHAEAPSIKAAWREWMRELRAPKSHRPRPRRRASQSRAPAPGHRQVFQSIKSWNPASISFVEARDEKEARARQKADAKLQGQISEVQEESRKALLELREELLAIIGGFALLVAAGFIAFGAQLRRNT
jgi:hypothetical protein